MQALPPDKAVPEQSIEIDENALWQASDALQEAYSDIDAMGVFEQVDGAVWAMADGEMDKAKELLRSSADQVAEIRRRNPGVDLWPISVTTELVNAAPQGLAEIHALRGQALAAMNSGDLPAARTHLSKLVSEVRVTTTKASLRGWSATIAKAEALLDESKPEETCDALADGFGDVQEDYGVKPVPVALAEHELKLAEESSDAAEFRSRLRSARHQLNRAEALGYTGKGTGYEEIKAAIRKAVRKGPAAPPKSTPPPLPRPPAERKFPAGEGPALWTENTKTHESHTP